MKWEELGFEEDCPVCNGTTYHIVDGWNGSVEVLCDHCNRTGKVPTELGNKLLEFMKANLKGKVNW